MKTKYIYPYAEVETIDCGVMDMTQKVYHKGISLREHYAGLALEGLLSSFTEKSANGSWGTEIEETAKVAVKLADALLNALSETDM